MGTNQRLTLAATLMLGLAACAPQKSTNSAPTAATQSSTNGIIGGELVLQGSAIAKSTVLLVDPDKGALCTGSLLKDNLVVTAAHCIPLAENAHLIVAFTTDMSKVKDTTLLRGVDQAEINPQYFSQSRATLDEGDIALVHFAGDVPAGYVPATLLQDRTQLKDGAAVVLAGYGITDGTTKVGAGVLRSVVVSIASATAAKTEIMLDQTHGKGACHGDSGGPAYIYDAVTQSYQLWGVTSRGMLDKNNDCTHYSAYTNILAHGAWLAQATQTILNPKPVEPVAPVQASAQ